MSRSTSLMTIEKKGAFLAGVSDFFGRLMVLIVALLSRQATRRRASKLAGNSDRVIRRADLLKLTFRVSTSFRARWVMRTA